MRQNNRPIIDSGLKAATANGTGSRRRVGSRLHAASKRVLVLAAAIPLIALVGTAASMAKVQIIQGHVPSKSTTQLLELIFFEGARLVDVRPQDEYRRGHILGALHLAAVNNRSVKERASNRIQLEARLTGFGITKATHLVLYDGKNGRAATQTALWLRSRGYRQTAILKGGLRKWLKVGGTLSTRPVAIGKPTFSSTPGPFQLTVGP